MKPLSFPLPLPLPLLLLLLLPFPGHAEKLLLRGKYVEILRLLDVTPSKEAIFDTPEGPVTIPWSTVPPESKAKYQARYTATLLAMDEKAATQKLSTPEAIDPKLIPLRQLESNLKGYAGRAVWIKGKLDTTNLYHAGYSSAQKTHVAFTVRSDGKAAYVYMPRELGETTRARVIARPDQDTYCLIEFPFSRIQEGESSIHATLLETIPAPAPQKPDPR